MSKTQTLRDGEIAYARGSAATPYTLKNIGGVLSCSCPAWRNQSRPIDRRTCKHLKRRLGEEVELERVGEPPQTGKAASSGRSAGADAPPILLAQRWDNEQVLDGWWMSEKLDGVRAYWTGERFLSRAGNEYLAPDWFAEDLGTDPLDGELWIGRGQFQETVSVVRRHDRSDHWKRVRYLVFDLPASELTFEERLAGLDSRFGEGCEYASVLKHERCNGLDHIERRLAEVEAAGGEGLMMRKPLSKYVAGRSATLLKIKSFLDAEARVIEHLAGKGRHKGRLGALRVELPDRTRFSVGTGLSDAEREAPPEIGSIVTFRYQELTNDGVPRFPTFVGVRADFVWPGAPEGNERPGRPSKQKRVSAKQDEPAERVGEPLVKRYFEFHDDKTSKFWEIAVDGAAHTTRYGRVGASGQSKLKEFGDPAAALKDAEKRVASKKRKGYQETRL